MHSAAEIAKKFSTREALTKYIEDLDKDLCRLYCSGYNEYDLDIILLYETLYFASLAFHKLYGLSEAEKYNLQMYKKFGHVH